jgi:hypothetical protein
MKKVYKAAVGSLIYDEELNQIVGKLNNDGTENRTWTAGGQYSMYNNLLAVGYRPSDVQNYLNNCDSVSNGYLLQGFVLLQGAKELPPESWVGEVISRTKQRFESFEEMLNWISTLPREEERKAKCAAFSKLYKEELKRRGGPEYKEAVRVEKEQLAKLKRNRQVEKIKEEILSLEPESFIRFRHAHTHAECYWRDTILSGTWHNAIWLVKGWRPTLKIQQDPYKSAIWATALQELLGRRTIERFVQVFCRYHRHQEWRANYLHDLRDIVREAKERLVIEGLPTESALTLWLIHSKVIGLRGAAGIVSLPEEHLTTLNYIKEINRSRLAKPNHSSELITYTLSCLIEDHPWLTDASTYLTDVGLDRVRALVIKNPYFYNDYVGRMRCAALDYFSSLNDDEKVRLGNEGLKSTAEHRFGRLHTEDYIFKQCVPKTVRSDIDIDDYMSAYNLVTFTQPYDQQLNVWRTELWDLISEGKYPVLIPQIQTDWTFGARGLINSKLKPNHNGQPFKVVSKVPDHLPLWMILPHILKDRLVDQ